MKVVQSGEGADELFGGYWIYHDQYEFSKYFKVPRALRAAGGAVAQKLPPFHGVTSPCAVRAARRKAISARA